VPQATPNGYAAALARGLQSAAFGIDPAETAELQGVQDDLQRATISSSARSPGVISHRNRASSFPA